MKTKILIIEDDPHILMGLEEVFKSDGFEVAVCNRGDQAVDSVVKHQPSLVVLDVMLPGLSGYEICRGLRTRGFALPVLMLTAKAQEMDKVAGLELGADDYVTKPFGIQELLARIHALLRRAASPPNVSPAEKDRFQIGTAVIDPKRLQITRGDSIEGLTSRELKLLQLFYGRPAEVFSREHLLKEIWGYHYCGTTRTLDQTIVQLRRKLGDNGSQPRHILTVHGVGYKLMI